MKILDIQHTEQFQGLSETANVGSNLRLVLSHSLQLLMCSQQVNFLDKCEFGLLSIYLIEFI